METNRLYIRRFTADDWSDLYEYLSDAEVVKYEPYSPLTEAQCKEAAKLRAASKDFWAVCLKDGKLIGNVYLAEKAQANWELGYVFNRAYQGKGYAAEAVTTLVDQVFGKHAGHRIYAECNPENRSSWRLLERVGFQREGHLRKNVYFQCTTAGTPVWQDTYI